MATSAPRLGDEGGGLIGRGDLWVQHDVEVVVLSQLVVALLASGSNPIGERLSNPGVDDVAHVGPRHLADLLDDWQRVNDNLVGEAPVQNQI